MNKNLQKLLKINESTISMGLGVLVLVAIAVLVLNYLKTQKEIDTPIELNPEIAQKEHVVEKGESLWVIAEKELNDGYQWKAIAEANEITNPGLIEVGQTLKIPSSTNSAEKAQTKNDDLALATAIPEALSTTAPEITEAPVASVIPTTTPVATQTPNVDTANLPTEYTVEHGDSLWKISEKVYGTGYKWREIAKANKLTHPSLIHAGNVLSIPR